MGKKSMSSFKDEFSYGTFFLLLALFRIEIPWSSPHIISFFFDRGTVGRIPRHHRQIPRSSPGKPTNPRSKLPNSLVFSILFLLTAATQIIRFICFKFLTLFCLGDCWKVFKNRPSRYGKEKVSSECLILSYELYSLLCLIGINCWLWTSIFCNPLTQLQC